ncbi:MAG: glutaminyl-peptide cyclotransferase, partial [Chitinophagaceae bacterium]
MIIFFLSVSMSCTNTNTTNENNGAQTNIPTISYTVVASYPHDISSFTQGLVFYNGKLLESTGNYGKSKLLLTDIKTGKALKTLNLDSVYFG